MKKETIQHFFSNVEFTDTCWNWIGSRLNSGYGQITIDKKYYLAHRLSYELKKGEIADTIDHLCRNRACINPDHLEDVSNRTNLLRGYGACAVNARKTHCKKGHKYTVENTYSHPDGRDCRLCIRERTRKYLFRKSIKEGAIA